MSDPITSLPAAVAAMGALPVPVGDQPLDDQRLAEIREHLASTRNWSIGNLAARDLLAEVERLRTERHSTNEVLSDAAEALREMRDRLAKYELPTAEDMPGMRHAIRATTPTAEEAS